MAQKETWLRARGVEIESVEDRRIAALAKKERASAHPLDHVEGITRRVKYVKIPCDSTHQLEQLFAVLAHDAHGDVLPDVLAPRFAGGGSDGAIAVWRSDQNFCQNAEPFFFRPPPTPTSRVEQLSFASSTAICAVGSHLDCDGASFVLWDTLCPARAAAAMKAHQVIISRRTNPMTVCRLSRVLDCTARLFAHTIY